MRLKHILFILLGLGIGFLLVRGGAGAVVAAALPLLKFVLPFAIAYLGVKFLRAKLQRLARGEQHEPQHDATIDICPECGEVMTARHVCKQSER